MKILFEYGKDLSPHQLHAANELLHAVREKLDPGESLFTLPPGTGFFAALMKRLATHPDIVHRGNVIRRLGLHRARTFILPGFDPLIYRPRDKREQDEFRQRHHLPEKYLLMCGPDVPVRNLMTVITAMRQMDSTSTLPLVVPGLQSKCEVRREIERRKMDDCLFAIDDVSEEERPLLFASATLYLDPGLGATARQGIVEAMACGTPVVVSATLISRKLFRDAAKLVHPRDPMEWSRALRAAQFSLEWHENATARGLQLSRQFTWPVIATQLLNLYRKLYDKKWISFG